MIAAPGRRLPVALDAMGGDDAPQAIVQGALEAVRHGENVILIGDERRLRQLLPSRGPTPQIAHADEVVSMDQGAASVRRMPDSSIRRTMALVGAGEACAAVCCGHTGASMVSARLELGSLDGVERAAIATLLPRSDGGRLVLLDAGANVDCRPEHLACFALLGAAYASVLGVDAPRVGLLSNGEEEGKGNGQVRTALPLIKALDLDVVGPVEPHTALAGGCDVLVCDGFVGNVLLKSAEAVIATALQILREEIKGRPSGVAGSWMLRSTMQRFHERLAWDAHGGALLLGTRGVVVVGHGRANPEAVCSAIALAREAVDRGLVQEVAARLAGSGA